MCIDSFFEEFQKEFIKKTNTQDIVIRGNANAGKSELSKIKKMNVILGVDVRSNVKKSDFNNRKWVVILTWADIIDGKKVWRNIPNYISELFKTKKEATAEMTTLLDKYEKQLQPVKTIIATNPGEWQNHLTENKEYYVLSEDKDTYSIVDNSGSINQYFKARFVCK